jgi:hypothetical protein
MRGMRLLLGDLAAAHDCGSGEHRNPVRPRHLRSHVLRHRERKQRGRRPLLRRREYGVNDVELARAFGDTPKPVDMQRRVGSVRGQKWSFSTHLM